MTARQLGVFCMAFLTSTSCQNEVDIPAWPPRAESAVRTFTTHQDDVRALRDMMAETLFMTVTRIGEDSVHGFEDVGGEMVVNETPPDSERWLELMEESQVATVTHVDEVFVFNTSVIEPSNDRVEAIIYFYDDDLAAKKCVDEFRSVSCGVCDLLRNDGWTIRYLWLSGKYIEEYFQSSFEMMISESEGDQIESDSFEVFHEKKNECLRKSLEEMGYENPTDYF